MSIREKIKKWQTNLKASEASRSAQFANYLDMVDKYSKRQISNNLKEACLAVEKDYFGNVSKATKKKKAAKKKTK